MCVGLGLLLRWMAAWQDAATGHRKRKAEAMLLYERCVLAVLAGHSVGHLRALAEVAARVCILASSTETALIDPKPHDSDRQLLHRQHKRACAGRCGLPL